MIRRREVQIASPVKSHKMPTTGASIEVRQMRGGWWSCVSVNITLIGVCLRVQWSQYRFLGNTWEREINSSLGRLVQARDHVWSCMRHLLNVLSDRGKIDFSLIAVRGKRDGGSLASLEGSLYPGHRLCCGDLVPARGIHDLVYTVGWCHCWCSIEPGVWLHGCLKEERYLEYNTRAHFMLWDSCGRKSER